MRTIIVDARNKNKKLWYFLKEHFMNMPESALHKAFRKKDIKVNGKRVVKDYIVSPGDIINVYIPDNVLYGKPLDHSMYGKPLNYSISDTCNNINSNANRKTVSSADSSIYGSKCNIAGSSMDIISDTSTDINIDSSTGGSSDGSTDSSTDSGIDNSIDNSMDNSIDSSMDNCTDNGTDSSIDDNMDGSTDSNINNNIYAPIYKTAGFTVVYEDENILIVNKHQGIAVHPNEKNGKNQSENEFTLIDLVREYLESKGEYNPLDTSSFPPSLCHRLDRNTGGLVIIAKNQNSYKFILDKIKHREIRKLYQCLVKGRMKKNSDELKAFLEKDRKQGRVYIHNIKKPGTLEIITKYRVLSYKNGVSKLEVELVTGRTHQIRAHLAFIGHPIVGDSKYGINSFNRKLGMKKQALWAYKIILNFKDEGQFNYLKGKTFTIDPPW